MTEIIFCNDWMFYKMEENDGLGNGVPVTLPHDAMLRETRSADCESGSAGAYFPGGKYMYEKKFSVPADWQSKKVLIRFEGVYRNAEIYVNGTSAGKIIYGYTERSFDLSGLLIYGETNEIRVTVDNSQVPNSRWYTGSGIYRPVTLFVMDRDHIEPDGIRISTISYNPAKIEVSVQHSSGDGSEVNIRVNNGQDTVAEGTGNECVLEIPDARLWSDDDPYLYRCEVELIKDGNVTDSREIAFGIRKIEWSPNGLTVNGQETLLRGGCIHHDNGILGACSYAEAEERKVRIMKEYGYNAIRSSHNPCSRALLDACDRYGMYVIDELWDMWYQHKSKYDYASDFMECWEDDIKSMVAKDQIHPSVLMYSIGNEISEPAQKEGMDAAEKIISLLHSLDNTRPVTGGMNLMIITNAAKGLEMYNSDGGINTDAAVDIGGSGQSATEKKENGQASQMTDMSQMDSTMFNQMTQAVGPSMNHMADSVEADRATSPILDALDIAGYNYASGRYPLEEKAHPDRVLYGSETFPQDLPTNWEMVERYPYLIGDFMWTAWDYLGEAGIGAWTYSKDAMSFDKPYPWLLGGAGVIDLVGHGDGGALLARAVWGKNNGKTGIAVTPANHPGETPIKSTWRGTNAIPSWSWKGCEGNDVSVEVYTQAAKAALFLNGEKIGEKEPENCKAVFDVEYQSGTLQAVGYDAKGRKMEEGILRSAEGPVRIHLKKEEGGTESEIVFVNVDLCGENGLEESNMDETLSIKAYGAEVLAFGSARRRSEESFVSGSYTTYYGRALAVVRITDPENAQIEVEGETLEKAVLKL